MTTDEAVELCDAVRNLAALYDYRMCNWGNSMIEGDGLVDFLSPRGTTLRGHIWWTLERWVTFFKVNDRPPAGRTASEIIAQGIERLRTDCEVR